MIKSSGQYVMAVKGTQRSLQCQLKELPWRAVPVGNKLLLQEPRPQRIVFRPDLHT